MVDSSAKLTKKNKRKLNSSEEKRNLKKRRRNDSSKKEGKVVEEGESSAKREEPELNPSEERPWRNLHLILSLQNKGIDLQKKLELAFNFVDSREKEERNDVDEDHETVNISRLIVFLNDWVQSLLVSPEKKVKVDGIVEACLDTRCWRVFKFCLKESSKLHVSLNLSRNLLRAIGYIARNILSLVSDTSLSSNESVFVGEGFELYGVVFDCVSLLFSFQSGLANENLELWVPVIDVVLQLVHKIYVQNLDGCNIGAFALQFSCMVLEPFAKFLRIHPTRKNGFRDFVDKLLEPLLLLVDVLYSQVNENNSGWTKKLLQLVEEVLSHGLFHPAHIDGFLGLRSVEKYAGSLDGKANDSKVLIKSYHRHLFDKLESIIKGKKDIVLSGIGQLFNLFVDRVKRQKGALGTGTTEKTEGSRHLEDDLSAHSSTDPSRSSSAFPDNDYSSSNFSAEAQKSVFDLFVQLLEPLLLKMDGYIQSNLVAMPSLLDVHCTLKSINSLLVNFLHEKVYVRTEDISEGACFNFLKKVYDMIVSFAAKLVGLSELDGDSKTWREMFPLLAKELFLAIGYFLDIEYDVIGNDLISLWLMMLSYLTIGLSFLDSPNQCLLTSPILDLGCQVVNLYSALRKVNNSIFTLCKAVRLLISHHHQGEMSCTRLFSQTISVPNVATAASVGILLCSQEFRLAIYHAIKSIPEGQASELIQQLTADVAESMEWMKIDCSITDGEEIGKLDVRDNGMLIFHMQAELLGRVLSEIYMILLDTLTVTAGNCALLGPYMKELLSTIYPCISSLAGQHPDGVEKLLFSVMQRTSESTVAENEKEKHGISTQWIFVFLFRMYISCRSLYRQIISLTAPSASRKLSSAMQDAFTAYAGRDWMEKPKWTDEGYFSWIINPSPSLLDLIHRISNTYIEDNFEDCCPLIYVLYIMSLQRLVDLNRLRSSIEYLLEQNEKLMQVKKLDDADLSLYSKKDRKLKRRVLVLEQEAVELTDFMLGRLSLVDNYHSSIFSSDDTSCEKMAPFEVDESYKWDFGICSLNKKSLPIAIWWIICQNIDIWCIYAAAKKFKKFLTLLIQTSLPCLSNSFPQVEKHKIDKDCQLKKITIYQISQGLLNDSTLYEHKFVRRNLASSFCHALENSFLLLFGDSSVSDRKFRSSPFWPEVLRTVDNSSVVVSGRRSLKHESATRSISNSSDELSSETSMKQKAFLFNHVKSKDCKSLLNLLCWMPKGFLSSKSFSKLATCVINLERIVVAELLDCHSALSAYGFYELFQLFVSCRRSLKHIIIASCEEKIEASLSSLLSVAEGAYFVAWLFKSVSAVIGLLDTMPGDSIPESELKKFSLMDHTSYVFFAISKYQFGQVVHLIGNSEQPYSGVGSDPSILNEPGLRFNYLKGSEALRSLSIVAECLREKVESLLLPLKGALDNAKVGMENKAVNINKMSFTVSCFGGFLWGLASALNQEGEKSGELKAKLLRWKWEPLSKLNLCINVFVDFISDLLRLFLENNQQPRSDNDARSSQKLDYNRDSQVFNVDLVEPHCLNKHLLQGLMKGDHPDKAVLLRQVLITYSAFPRLNVRVNGASFLSGIAPLLIDISQALLLELANSCEIPPPFTFVWLDGAVKYLEELGTHFALTDSTLNGNAYANLIELHLLAIGKCISLQGKRATLESRERESSTKILHGDTGFAESFLSHGSHCLDEFKARLRMSFKMFIKNPSDSLLLSAIQAIEKALVGVQGGQPVIYGIKTGSTDGGMVSPTVAAGIDCLDLILEYGSGRKCLSVVKRHIQSLVAALFNIILHLQSPLIFCGNFVSNDGDRNPDPGSVVLMCVEELIRVSGKHALFRMDPWHIGQSLRIAGVLFQDFHQLRLSEAPVSSKSLPYLNKENHNNIASMKYCAVVQQFSANLFAACCRLLYTVLKHHKSECERCIAVLEESVSLLLLCLETVDADLVVRKGYFSWEMQEGVTCASFLRRIYEEIRQQKDVLGGHCYKFLSTYIWVYSGYGPHKTGIRREIDEALRPGVYALIDACSANDLQYLHTVFGEGPCRNTLASLQRDYKLNFQYEGKV
ncbi:hypothetical protein DITRI_Ditri08aG0133500 [Diplodiscus trichospermus]